LQQLPKLSEDILIELKHSKNLLAFSAGSDSTALFFILQALDIKFDIAIVNYQTRAYSNDEEAYAKELAKKYNKKIFLHKCSLEKNNFEHRAREERYNFFEKTIHKFTYETLLTAHQLNDKLEWFLMQLSRGSGLVEMIGMNEKDTKKDYNIIRPLLHVSKEDITKFLHVNNIKHYLDISNDDEKYFRNTIRKKYASSFIEEFKSGVQKSFEYLKKDADTLIIKDIKQIKELFIIPRDTNELLNIRSIDKIIKKLGYLLSSAQREEIIKTKHCIISDKIAICYTQENIFISPHVVITMDKKTKETYRKAKIPIKIRPYIYKENININYLVEFIS